MSGYRVGLDRDGGGGGGDGPRHGGGVGARLELLRRSGDRVWAEPDLSRIDKQYTVSVVVTADGWMDGAALLHDTSSVILCRGCEMEQYPSYEAKSSVGPVGAENGE